MPDPEDRRADWPLWVGFRDGRRSGVSPALVRLTPRLLRQAVVKGWNDRLLGLSAEAAFWQLLSLPSLLLALLASLGYVAGLFGHDTVQRVEAQLERTFSRAFTPEVVSQVLSPTLHEILTSGRADVISIGFVIALWAGSSATATFVNTITIAYGMRDLRGAVRSRLLALALFLGTMLVGVVLLPMLVLGPTLLTDLFPRRLRPTAGDVISGSYYPVVVVVVLLGLTTLYHLAPPRRMPWRRGVPGALLALVVFLGGSIALRSYLRFILDRNHAYGTLASPIAALLFFFVLALGVLLGAEFNAVIQAYRPAPVRTSRVLDPRAWQRLDQTPPAEVDLAPPTVAAPAADSKPAPGIPGALRAVRDRSRTRLVRPAAQTDIDS